MPFANTPHGNWDLPLDEILHRIDRMIGHRRDMIVDCPSLCSRRTLCESVDGHGLSVGVVGNGEEGRRYQGEWKLEPGGDSHKVLLGEMDGESTIIFRLCP